MAKKSGKRNIDAATQLGESVQRFTEVKEIVKLANERRADIELRVARSAEAAYDALQRLAHSSNRVDLVQEEAQCLRPHLSEIVTAHDLAGAESKSRQREVKAQKARVRMRGDELEFRKRRESTNCDSVVMARKVVDAQGHNADTETNLHQETLSSYDFIRHGVDEALVEVSTRLNKAFDCGVRSLQQSVRDAVRGAAEKPCESLINAPVVIDKRLEAIVGQAAGTVESAKPEASSLHTASRSAQTGASKDRPSSNCGLRSDAFKCIV